MEHRLQFPDTAMASMRLERSIRVPGIPDAALPSAGRRRSLLSIGINLLPDCPALRFLAPKARTAGEGARNDRAVAETLRPPGIGKGRQDSTALPCAILPRNIPTSGRQERWNSAPRGRVRPQFLRIHCSGSWIPTSATSSSDRFTICEYRSRTSATFVVRTACRSTRTARTMRSSRAIRCLL